ncbi:phage tail tape measure protein [Escherichia coli]|nr:phage tail tape measure protein [Escherichia coli]
MSDEIGKISLVADTSSLERAANELDKFSASSNKAATAADSLNDSNAQTSAKVKDVNAAFTAGAAVREQTRRSYEGTTKELQGLQRELVAIRGRVDPVGVAFDNLAAMSDKLREGLRQKLIDPSDYAASVKGIDNLTSALERSVYESSAAGKAAKEAAQADKVATVAKENFLKKLKEQVATQGMSRQEQLQYRAAQLGVASSADIYIKKIDESSKALHGFSLKSASARREIGVMLGELARGNIGALRGSSITLANRSGLIDQLMTFRGAMVAGSLGLVAGGLIGVAKAAYEGAQESEEFNKQLILTGNYAGKTAGQLQNLAKSFSGKGITQHDAASALASVIGSGAFKSNQIESVTKAALAMQQATGQAVDETIKNFQRLYENPTQGSIELNKQLHYLTSSQYEYIASLERRGFKEAAGQAAADVYSKAEQQRSQQVIDNLGYIERSIKTAINWWNKYYDAARGIGREDTNSTQLQAVRDRIKQLSDNSKPGAFGLGGIGDGGASAKELKELKDKEKELAFVINSQEGYAQSQIKAKEADEKRTKSLKYQNDILSKNVSWQQKRSAALTELWRNISLAPKDWSKDQRALAVKQINNDNKPPTEKKGAVYKDDTAARELAASQQRLAVLRGQSEATDKMTQQESRLLEFNQQIADLKNKSILTADQKSLLSRESEIRASLQLEANIAKENAQRDKAVKAMKTMSDYAKEIEERNQQAKDSFGQTTKGTQREAQESQLKKTYNKSLEGITDAAQLEKIAAEYVRARDKLHEGFRDEDARESQWVSGLNLGVRQFAENSLNVFQATAQIGQTTMQSLSDMATDLASTGKANIKEFGTSILKMILQVINQLLVAYAIQSALGWMSGGASFSSTGLNDGTKGIPMPPKFDAGGYTGDGGKYEPKGIVHGGEFVFTKESTNRIGTDNLYALMRGYANGGLVGGSSSGRAPMLGLQGGGSASGPIIQTSVVVNNEGGQQQRGGNSDAIGKAYQQVIDTSVRDGISKALRPGGLIWMAQNKR